MLHSIFASQTPSVRAPWAPTAFTSAKGTNFTWQGCRNLAKWSQTWTSKQESFPEVPAVLDFSPSGSPVKLCTASRGCLQPCQCLHCLAERGWRAAELGTPACPEHSFSALLLCIPLSLPLEFTPASLAYHRLFRSPHHPSFPGALGSSWSFGPEARAISPEQWGGRWGTPTPLPSAEYVSISFTSTC